MDALSLTDRALSILAYRSVITVGQTPPLGRQLDDLRLSPIKQRLTTLFHTTYLIMFDYATIVLRNCHGIESRHAAKHEKRPSQKLETSWPFSLYRESVCKSLPNNNVPRSQVVYLCECELEEEEEQGEEEEEYERRSSRSRSNSNINNNARYQHH
ncbi:hypothetical protein M0802_007719 [Mischocyttarus mexicanus]|nr:hypothetical protein M0802_007719 [Mischocyttarus mexicanus]